MKQKKAKLPHTISNAGQIDTDQEQSFERRGRLFLFRFFTIILTRILIGLALLWQY
jgi:hypothetical protein